jgi:hypothetical protein
VANRTARPGFEVSKFLVARLPLPAMGITTTVICECAKLPDLFKLESQPGFDKRTTRIATGNWIHLHRCAACGQSWRIDEWDKFQVQFVVRIPPGVEWETFDSSPLQKQFLVRSRGGLTHTECAWSGCHGKAVQGVAYCAEHLYQTGVRE